MEGVAEKKKAKKSKAKAEDVIVEEAVEDEQVVGKEVKKEKSKKKRSREGNDEVENVAQEEAVPQVCVEVAPKRKPLPPGYKCNACGQEGHAIYECTLKIPKKRKAAASAAAVPAKREEVVSPKVKKAAAKTATVEDSEGVGKADPNKNKVYVSGLPFDMNNEKCRTMFEDEGCAIASLSLVMFEDNQSKCRGFGFVTFADELSTTTAIAMTGRDMGKKTLSVVQCVVKEKPEQEISSLSQAKKPRIPRCYRCGEMHDASTCHNPRICYRCRASDHISSQCPKKKNTSA